MSVIWTLGPHKMWFEEPDTVRLATVGVYDQKLMEESNALAFELKKTHPTLYLISDMSRSTGMSAEARKLLVDKPELLPYSGTVTYGLNFAVRTMVNMMVRAGELLGRNTTSHAFAVVADEAGAKAWVLQQREAARAKPAS
ncbi:hypothetical protein JY651_23600 [Pyxidicoccus parkwayensis]|jgi:hypothetical protein|uniref:Uncharacterized protein n=1 Tax=Pyxidicoccus parkwayensis TaxID=2813578 RepID=A0ABX7PB73_9BACT|nr:hypothetical protein [Pyxidicoccus parkwaysis]QSQ27707.1 hypothetical protein JY651_23600 [Pyxidicoccus parkwaysis]